MQLFHRDHIVGVFRGFSGSGLEFHADLVLPYRSEFQSSAMHGQFVLVALETENEAVLGRVTSVSAQGRLASTSGEDYAVRAVQDDRPIPEDLRDQYLRYKIDIRILGVVRARGEGLDVVASHRRVPHVGAKVAFLSPDVLRAVAGSDLVGADLGFFALGEFIWSGSDPRLSPEPWMVVQKPDVVVRFDIEQLVARRSFVFARAGFGKSNLVKLLFSGLYAGENSPSVPKRGGRRVPVGTVIFDPDGEYFWPDDKGRPGLCDVPGLRNRLALFTDRKAPSSVYGSFVVDGVKLDIRQLSAAKVISLVLGPEQQERQNVQKLRQLNPDKWRRLVDAVHGSAHETPLENISEIIGLTGNQEIEALAARANMVRVVRQLHDPSSRLLDALLRALGDGKLCVVDISRMRGSQGLNLAGVLMQHIFEHNQEEFTAAEPRTIPTIAVLEEAQSVLNGASMTGDSPFVAWVKEGRKYDLGAVLITQQPGSLSADLLSQGDNWFVFHLLSAVDLTALKKANAHFSDDLLSSLLNEPLVGHGVTWSSVGGAKYPIPVRVLDFARDIELLDKNGSESIETYASLLRGEMDQQLQKAVRDAGGQAVSAGADGGSIDVSATVIKSAIERVKQDQRLMTELTGRGKPWRGVISFLEPFAPSSTASDQNAWAARSVTQVLDGVFGNGGWESFKRPKVDDPSVEVRWVRAKQK
ncbi:ATP-binding protein [Streptomyces sp. NPDC018029]|uniref:ATP-binding protein n=1 Tax=Streptomyces sp. NPDC018029 TaxID=3365032 RepID=UPI0037AB3E4D